MDESVSVPRWALEFVLENANFQDEGPWPEGWPSPQMEKAIKALADVLCPRLSLNVTSDE